MTCVDSKSEKHKIKMPKNVNQRKTTVSVGCTTGNGMKIIPAGCLKDQVFIKNNKKAELNGASDGVNGGSSVTIKLDEERLYKLIVFCKDERARTEMMGDGLYE
ncbi:MAG: hypothetical protein LUI39_01225 [Lachnospiraceae bacterium]|nr:hypothetical protein [Lachnospiraceae bacterium]